MTIKENILDAELKEAISTRYLSYAVSTIAGRAFPDVRDGLKPVHRRILYAMRELKLDEKSGFKKCARVVGDVMGKYHPHGDAAIYDAMVRLAQSFASRYPLVDGQGNFGNIDGDSQAAMRYTEARLTENASLLMGGLEDNTVDFKENYSGEDIEPVVLPASFPNLLANGTEGIAVGMATSIPPHNLGELFDALIYLIKNPLCTVKDLFKFVKGPDFPTGGVVIDNRESLLDAYETGRGKIRIRAKWEKEELSHGLYQIIVTDIPYQVRKSDLIEVIANLLQDKKLPLLSDIRDESAEDIRIVLEPRSRAVDAESLMESIFRQSKMQTTYSFNMNVLDKGIEPKIMNLKEVLESFIAHRVEILIRKSEHRLNKINARLEILEGFLKAYLNLDEIIAIIRNEDEPRPILMEKFALSENQAEAILNMKLRSLRKLEEIEINSEHKKLSEEAKELRKILSEEALRFEKISEDFQNLKKKYSKDKRRTIFKDVPFISAVTTEEAIIEKEAITIVYSKKGWIRAVKGFVNGSELKFKDDDEINFSIHCYTTDKINFFGTNGRFYTLLADRISRGRGFGEAIRFLIDLPAEADILNLFVHSDEDKYLLISFLGKGFVVNASDCLSQTKSGKIVMSVQKDDYPLSVMVLNRELIALVGQNRRMLIFETKDIPVINKGQGVFLQRYDIGGISDLRLFNKEEGLSYKTINGVIKKIENISPWFGKRATKGSLLMPTFLRNNKFE